MLPSSALFLADSLPLWLQHRHHIKIDWLTYFVCLVSGCCKNTLWRDSTSGRHITKLEQSIFRIYLWTTACLIDVKSLQNGLLKVCYVPATSASLNRLLFFLFLLWPWTVLMKQTRQAVHAVKQPILLRCLWLASIFFIQNTNNVKKQINLSLDAKKQLNSY